MIYKILFSSFNTLVMQYQHYIGNKHVMTHPWV